MTDDAWRVRLRDQGHRITPQREAVLRAVHDLPHPTAESVHEHLTRTQPALSLSTVYRTLAVLQEFELITHAHVGTGPPVYHLADAPAHLHLACLSCGRVLSLPAAVADDFAAAVADRTGFTVDATHSAVYGHCSDCLESDG